MTDAPERIRLHKEKGKPWTSAQWDDDFYNPLEDVEIFIRTDIAEQRVREAEAAAYRRAMGECLAQREDFLSPAYASGQPFSSFGERFACSVCADRIFLLIQQQESGG